METAAIFMLGAGNARVSFSVRWFGVIQVRGSFDDVSGTVTIPGRASPGRASPGAGAGDASVSIQVKAQSVRTGISLRDRHLRGMRFLDSAPHPVIRFVSDRITHHNGVWDLRGRLSLRGLDRTLAASVRDEPASPSDRRLTAEFTVPRRPHGIGMARGIRRLNPLLWAIGDDVTLRVELLVPATLLQPIAEHVPGR